MNFDLLVLRWRWIMAFTMLVDLAITLHGQPLSYWRDPSTAFEPNHVVRAVMVEGWTTFVAVSFAYMTALLVLVSLLKRKPGFITLLVFVLVHFYAASTWLDMRWRLGMAGPILYGMILSFLMTVAFKGKKSDKEEKKGKPNQALEPTTTAVTDRASARSAPAAVVAHL
jgi:hypothetical protein